MFDIKKIRADFPILSTKVNGYPLVYLDNAATSQKPRQVINSLVEYYSAYNANIHRGVHSLSQEATNKYEEARAIIQCHFNARKSCEIIFTSGTTESVNLVASSLSSVLKKGDEILISVLEHHSNIVPWQLLCEKTGAILKIIPIQEDGVIDKIAFSELLSERTKIVSVAHVSNTLGTINPVEEIIEQAHRVGAWVLLDGAQSCAHIKTDVQALDVDFYVTSAHKMLGPTGVGILYGKEEILRKLPPYKGGGEMIDQVSFEKTTYADLPHKFEAGTPNIAGVIAFGEAVNYLNAIGFEEIEKQEKALLDYATEKLLSIEGLEIYGTSTHKTAVISFGIKGLHPFDVGSIIDKLGIAVRTGNHCTQPLIDHYCIAGTIRASFAFYNTIEEVDLLYDALLRAKRMLL
ncbi:MAG: cysteine desulfurase [Flavobacteriaceae bacterium]|nr:cysteine desulfurase [Flavobacteriaceae bacterium]